MPATLHLSRGHAYFEKRSFKLTVLAMESFGRLGESGGEPIDRLTNSAVGGGRGWIHHPERRGEEMPPEGHSWGYTGGCVAAAAQVHACVACRVGGRTLG